MRAARLLLLVGVAGVAGAALSADVQAQSGREFMQRHKVREVLVTTGSGVTEVRMVRRYDRRGNLVAELGLGASSNDTLTRTTSRYDANDRVSSRTNAGFRGSPSKTWRYTYTRNSRGQLTGATIYHPDGDITRHTYVPYGQTTHSQEHVVKDSSGRITSWRRTVFDADLNPIRIERFDASGRLTERTEARYRGPAIAEESWVYDGAGKLVSRSVYTYAPPPMSDRPVLEETFDASGALTQRVRHTINGVGLRVETVTEDGAGKVQDRTRATYQFYP